MPQTTSNISSVRRTILQAIPIPELPGWESRMVLLEYPPGAAAPAHTHPVMGANFVVEGEVISQWEGGEAETFHAGQIFVDFADLLHTQVRNASNTQNLRMVVSYVIKVGEPTLEVK